MNDYYLRVEGVNLDNFVFDTNDLSTIRGGGLLLLNVPEQVEKVLEGIPVQVEPITKGASWGLFSFKAQGDNAAVEVARTVRKAFLSDPQYPQYRHATVVVDLLPAGQWEQYPLKKSGLTALNRWQQMQSPSVLPPREQDDDDLSPKPEQVKAPSGIVCQMDHVRPAVARITKGGEAGDPFDVSSSVYARREYGKAKKGKQWHQAMTGIGDLPDFVNDFNDLTSPGKDQDFGTLNKKMAVIYLDGNKFGERQRQYCTTAKRQREFDGKIRIEFQNGALTALLNEINNAKDWLNVDKLRFETLLWGGDEIIWVVPAWQGWWTLGRFYREVTEKPWVFPADEPLTLAAGLVFCHHNAPIHRITRLAKTLGDLAKHDRSRNMVAYQVLESFDHAGVDIEAFRKSRCPDGIKPSELIIDGGKMRNLIEPVTVLKKSLPKRRLHKLVQGLYEGIIPDDTPWPDLGKEIAAASRLIKSNFDHSNTAWLHLLDLWDYIGTANPGTGGSYD